jgi:outer membrane protein, multidrug efflux system
MRRRMHAAVFLAVFLAGCAAVGPDYKRPVLETPQRWVEDRGKAAPAAGLEETAWWESFGDPVLNSLIEQAVKTNLDVAQARARIVQARATLAATGASAWPAATGTGSFTRSKDSENMVTTPSTAMDTSPYNVYSVGFDASWEIDVFGGIRRSVEAAKANADAGVENLHDTVLTLLGDVARYYVELRSAQEQLEITQRNAETQRHTAAVTRERYRLGLTTYLDVAQAETQKLTTEADVPTIEAAMKQSIHRLGVLLGKDPNALKTELSEARPLPDAENIAAAGLPSELLVRRPDLRQAERKLAAASAEIGVATADLYPKFDLTFGMGLSSATASKLLALSSGYWSLVPQVSTLLFDAGKTRATIRGKQAVYEETLSAYRSAFLNALEEVENALTDYYTEQTRRGTLADSVRSAEEAVSLADERYRRGLINFLNVLEAQRTLYTAQSSLRKSDAKVLTSLISLYKALGGGWSAAGTGLAAGEAGAPRAAALVKTKQDTGT